MISTENEIAIQSVFPVLVAYGYLVQYIYDLDETVTVEAVCSIDTRGK